MKYASFVIPSRNGRIFLGQRNTPPHQGMFGAIGGKADFNTSQQGAREVVCPGGSTKISVCDTYRFACNLESSLHTAKREFCEEAMPGAEFREIVRIGAVFDQFRKEEVCCSIYLANVRGRFHPSTRELSKIKPLRDIAGENINPMTALALAEIFSFHEFYEGFKGSKYEPFANLDLEQFPSKLDLDFSLNPSFGTVRAYLASLTSNQ